VITLEPELEQLLQASLQGQGGSNAAFEPGLAERLQSRLAESAVKQESSGEAAVLMVAPQLRTTLARFTRATVPGLHVLAWNEIPDNRRVRLVAAVGR
jgi:flagellar biosynthesis protein FlhA